MTSKTLTDDCFRPAERKLRHFEAIALLRARTGAITALEEVALTAGAGRILADDVIAPRPIPLHTNAAVDGFGLCWSEELAKAGGRLPVVGRAAAGHPFGGAVNSGDAVEVLTGAVVPEGVTAIVMQEDVDVVGTDDAPIVVVPAGVKNRANIRQAGEDVAAGDTLFQAGHVLRPGDLAALASAGFATLPCRARLKVGVISTGDEVVPADGRALQEGEVFDANTPMLVAALSCAGVAPISYGIWPDTAAEIRDRLARAAAECDVLLTSGGASKGREDHVSAALAALGSRHFWQMAIKPGRPLMFGQIGDTAVVGLPGNPVAVFVCFLMYVFPLLRHLSGGGWPEPRRYPLPASFEIQSRKPGRREFWRASLVSQGGQLSVRKFANDGSGLITGLRVSDGLIEIDEDRATVRPGDLVDFIPFSQFGIADRG